MLITAPRPRPNSKPLLVLLALVFWLGLFCAPPASAQFRFKDYGSGGARPKVTPPDAIRSRAALLVDAKTGEVLYARNPDQQLLPASTTKLMTALIAYEKYGGLKGTLTVGSTDHAEPSNVPLVTGETMSLYNLFHALLIESANDAALCLGRNVAGSNAGFIRMMNQRALALGCFNTHFNNPNGLPAPSGTHYTSCSDLMRIFRAVLSHPDLRKICSTKEFTFRSASGTHNIRNHNRLLGYYPGMGPAKTGWTVASRHTYAASCTQNGRELLLTILDSPNKWADAQILFNWGFAQTSAQASATPDSGTPAPTVAVPDTDDDDQTAAKPATAPSGLASDVSTTPPTAAKKKKKQ